MPLRRFGLAASARRGCPPSFPHSTDCAASPSSPLSSTTAIPACKARFWTKFIVWGWSGVSLFFVLSGFLITGIILDSGSTPRFYANFYARRFLRIWPVYWLLLFLYYFFFPVSLQRLPLDAP